MMFACPLIGPDGEWNEDAMAEVKPQDVKEKFGVVSILGSQSGGKSTLLNYVFGTFFDTMDDAEPYKQTTRGVWVSRVPHEGSHVLVLDIEGSDSAERGDDEAVLERRVGTFCLAVSHVILLNLNCKDVGRKDASGWPLFEKLLRAYVGLPEVCRITPKPTLIAVLRDCNRKAAVDELKNTVIQRLKTVVQKVAAELRWSDVFNVTVGCLAHYEYEQDQFRVDCSSLSTLIAGCIREPLVTLIEFRDRASDTWEEIWYDPDIRACRQQLIAKRMSNLRRPIQKKISLTQPDNLFETTRQTPCQLYLTEALDAFAEQSRGLDKDELATQLRLYMQPVIEIAEEKGIEYLVACVREQITALLQGDRAYLWRQSTAQDERSKLQSRLNNVRASVVYMFDEQNYCYECRVEPQATKVFEWLLAVVQALHKLERRLRNKTALIGGAVAGLGTMAAVLAAPVTLTLLSGAAIASAVGTGGAFISKLDPFHQAPHYRPGAIPVHPQTPLDYFVKSLYYFDINVSPPYKIEQFNF